MKKAEIKVGEEYAYSRWNDYKYGADYIKVTGPAETIRSAHYPYSSQTLVPCVNRTGGAMKVRTRDVREPWGPYAERVAEHRKAVQHSRQQADVALTERGKTVLALAESLKAAGLVDQFATIYDEDTAVRAAEDGLFVMTDEENTLGMTRRFVILPLAEKLWAFYARNVGISLSGDFLLDLLADRESSVSRQHYIDTGRYMSHAEVAEGIAFGDISG